MKLLTIIFMESFGPILRFFAAVARLICGLSAILFLLVAAAVNASFVPGFTFAGLTVLLTVVVMGYDRLRMNLAAR